MKITINSEFKEKHVKFVDNSVFIDEKSIRKEITKNIIELGITPNCQGFHFLRECVMVILNNPSKLVSISKTLYPVIGQLFNTKSELVERNIRHSCETAFNKTYFSSICKLFGIKNKSKPNYKPSNTEVIAVLAENIRLLYPNLIK